jgi:hypothetical protein
MVPGDLSFGGRFFNVNFQPGWSVFILQNTRVRKEDLLAYIEHNRRGLGSSNRKWPE